MSAKTESKKKAKPEVAEAVAEPPLKADNISSAVNLLEIHYPDLKCIGDEWYLPKNGVYRLQNTNLVTPVALSVLTDEVESNKVAQEVIRTLEGRKQVPPESMRGFACFLNRERSEVLLCCRNGALAVSPDEATLADQDIEYSFGRQIRAKYDPNAACPEFDALMEKALPDTQDQDLFGSYSAYTLYPSCDLQTFLNGYGEGGTSKSTVFEAVASALGAENVTRIGFSELCGDGPGYSLPTLQRSALNLGAEAPQGELQESDRLKILVEGGEIPVRPIYGRPRPLRGYHTKIVLLGNCQPRFKYGTSAELRRLRVLHFQHKHENVDPLLDAKLAHEASGIFSRWLVPYLQKLLRNKNIPQGGLSSRRLMQQYAIQHDPHQAFMDRCCERGRAFSVPKASLLGAWRAFVAEEHLVKALRDEHWFFRRLYERYPETHSRRLGGKDRPYVVQGARLKPDVDVEPAILSDPDA